MSLWCLGIISSICLAVCNDAPFLFGRGTRQVMAAWVAVKYQKKRKGEEQKRGQRCGHADCSCGAAVAPCSTWPAPLGPIPGTNGLVPKATPKHLCLCCEKHKWLPATGVIWALRAPKWQKESEMSSRRLSAPEAQKVQNGVGEKVKMVEKELILTRFRLRFALLGPHTREAPGTHFGFFLPLWARRAQMTPVAPDNPNPGLIQHVLTVPGFAGFGCC